MTHMAAGSDTSEALPRAKGAGEVVRLWGLPIGKRVWDERRQGWRTSYLGGLVYSLRKGEQCVRWHVLGMRVYSRAWLRRKVLFFSWTTREWLRRLDAQIPPEYDVVYLFRHNIGETVVELMHAQRRVAAGGAKRPLLVVRDASLLDLFAMYLPEEGPEFRLIPLRQMEIFDAFGEHGPACGEVVRRVGQRRFICSTPRVGPGMRERLRVEPGLQFYRYITRSLGVPEEAPPAVPRLTPELRALAATRLQELRLEPGGFVVLAPECTTMQPLPAEFWQAVADALQAAGLAVLVNQHGAGRQLRGCLHADERLGVLFALAQQAHSIVSMASGLTIFLAAAGAPMHLLYLPFRRVENGYDTEHALRIYSLHHLPGVEPERVHEYPAEQMSPVELVARVLARD